MKLVPSAKAESVSRTSDYPALGGRAFIYRLSAAESRLIRSVIPRTLLGESTPAASNRGSFAHGAASGPVPAVHREVTLLTVGGESHGLMAGGRGLAKSVYVTAHAFGGEPEAVELADRADLVAGVAVNGRMSADQRKSILMLIDVVNGNSQPLGLWQRSHWAPFLRRCRSAWQFWHLTGALLKSRSWWQSAHCTSVCRPRSGNLVFEWLNSSLARSGFQP